MHEGRKETKNKSKQNIKEVFLRNWRASPLHFSRAVCSSPCPYFPLPLITNNNRPFICFTSSNASSRISRSPLVRGPTCVDVWARLLCNESESFIYFHDHEMYQSSNRNPLQYNSLVKNHRTRNFFHSLASFRFCFLAQPLRVEL